MEHSRFVVIDPDDGVIVVIAHETSWLGQILMLVLANPVIGCDARVSGGNPYMVIFQRSGY